MNPSALSYNPNLIRIDTRHISLQNLLPKLDLNFLAQRLDLPPEQQWSNSTNSQLIESIFLRFPLSGFCFYQKESLDSADYLVVAGSKMLNAIHQFVSGALPLTALQYFPQFENFTYAQIPRSYQRRLLGTYLVVSVIESSTPPHIVRNLVERINPKAIASLHFVSAFFSSFSQPG